LQSPAGATEPNHGNLPLYDLIEGEILVRERLREQQPLVRRPVSGRGFQSEMGATTLCAAGCEFHIRESSTRGQTNKSPHFAADATATHFRRIGPMEGALG
jgi:hypothetical protein